MFLTMSWFWRGFQSAIFYYVSCAPCSKFSYRRKRRKDYKRRKAERADAAERGLVEHPEPFTTNPYWREEMSIGPGPPVRKAQRDGRGKPENRKPKKERKLPTGGAGSSTDTGASSADTMVGGLGGEQGEDSSEGWNKRRYQREDEVLWGLEPQDTSSTSTSQMSRAGSSSRYQYYARNPAINDLHPPVVSTQPTNRIETQWMLQPPPKAKVMDGKERQTLANTPNRSRSTSGGSNWSKANMKKSSDMNLGRQIGERLMESKLKQGNLPQPADSPILMSRGPSAHSNRSAISSVVPGQPHDRDLEASTRKRSSSMKHKQSPLPPITISMEPIAPSSSAPRPALSTIPSETHPQPQKDELPQLRPYLTSANSTSSLQVLQELVAPSSQLNVIRNVSSSLPIEAISVSLPPVTQREDAESKLPDEDSYFSERGWDFPQTSKENDAVPPGHRWSMSI